MDVVERFESVETDSQDRPLEAVLIESVSIGE
jgi:hypothetical protein